MRGDNLETLLAYAYLWALGLASAEEYNSLLDELYLGSPNNDGVLLELEECSSDCKRTLARLQRYCIYETNGFDSNKFGRSLFSGLESAYKTNAVTIGLFAECCYAIWSRLPSSISMQEPFLTLCYAGDYVLTLGDEKPTRELYEKAFAFYKE